MLPDIPDYGFHDAKPLWGSQYLWPAVRSIVSSHCLPSRRAFDLGCGNGSTANMLSELGFDTTGIDPSESGIAIAKQAYQHCTFAHASGYEDHAKRFGQFGLVLSLEVLQHCAYPQKVAQRLFELVEPGGIALVSVTYHSYLKNLVLALTGRLDQHFSALWDAGPLKFFSMETCEALLRHAGFRRVEFRRVGRVPMFAKSMIAVAHKDA
jgi:2-polyprenyl-6-hydroxyphenyl methylase/3-demethylubiquinone-9 3-methyltransferase